MIPRKIFVPLIALFLAAQACTLPGASVTPEGTAPPFDPAQGEPVEPSAPPPPAETAAPPTDLPTEEPAPEATALPAAPPALRVAYISGDRNIWLYDHNRRTAIPLTTAADAIQLAISSDGQWIAYTRSAVAPQVELWLVAAEAIEGQPPENRALLTAADLSAFDPAAFAVVPYLFDWIPGTHKIVFTTRQEFEEGLGLILYDDLRTVDTDTGEIGALLPAGEGGNPFVSLDGLQIAFTTPQGVHLVNMDGTNLRRDLVVFPQVVTYSEYQYYPRVSWGTDSSEIVVIIPPSDPLAIPVLPTMVWRISAVSAAGELVGQLTDASFFGGDSSPAGDFSKLAYLRLFGDLQDNQQTLVIANLDGTGAHEVTTAGTGTLQWAWSPGGHGLVFWQVEPGGLYQAFIDGDIVQTIIIRESNILGPVQWLDETRILFWEREGELYRLVLLEIGGGLEVLAESPDLPGGFDFAP